MLTVRELRKSFGEHVAVCDVTFDVPDGKMVGFLGSNGAGKTTTMRMIMGIIAPDGGEVLMDGRSITKAQRARIGYMPEERGLYPKQSLEGQLAYLAELKGMGRLSALRVAREHLDRFGLGERRRDDLESLSLGNQQRVQIIASIMSDPVCLVLDEPFSGLDPKAIDDMAEVLREQTVKGVPVLFSSHQLDMVDRLCDEIVALAGGEIKASGSLEELSEGRPVRYRLVTRDPRWWAEQPGVVVMASGDASVSGRHQAGSISEITMELDAPDTAEGLLRESASRGELLEFGRITPTFSDIYREVTA